MNDSNLVWRVQHGCHCVGTRLASHAIIQDLVPWHLARVDRQWMDFVNHIRNSVRIHLGTWNSAMMRLPKCSCLRQGGLVSWLSVLNLIIMSFVVELKMNERKREPGWKTWHGCVSIYFDTWINVCAFSFRILGGVSLYACVRVFSTLWETRWAYHLKNTSWYNILKYSSPSMVYSFFEDFDRKIVVVPSGLWLPHFYPGVSGTVFAQGHLNTMLQGRSPTRCSGNSRMEER